MSENISEWPRLRAAGLFVVNLSLLLAGLFNLVMGCVQAFRGNQSMAISCLTAGLLLLLASTVDRFELLKGFGIEAKTRALDKALTEADVTLDQLRHLAEITSRSIVALSSGAGRFGSAPTIRGNASTVGEVRATLEKLKADPAKIREILQPWVRVTLFDAAQPLVNKIRDALTAVQHAANKEAMDIHEPRSPSDAARYAALIATSNNAADFNRDRIGDVGLWPLDSFQPRFTKIVAEMPVIDEEVRAKLWAEVDRWGPRFAHLLAEQELRDPDAWYALQR